MYTSCQESYSQFTCEAELLFSHLNVEVTPGETTNCARWRGQQSPVPFTGLQTPSVFCLFQHLSPSCGSFAADRRYQVGSVTSPPPQAQLTLTKTKVVPAYLERESRFPSEVWGSHWSPSPKPAGWRKHLSPHPNPAGISLLLLCSPPVPHISPRHETSNEIIKSSSVCGAQLKVTAACEFTFKNN